MKLLAVGLAALAFAHPAAASPCGDRIAKLQAQLGRASPAAGATTGGAAESDAAKLHHQPAPATANDAGAAADSEATLRNARFQNDLFNAEAAEHSGDIAGCEAAVSAAEKEAPR